MKRWRGLSGRIMTLLLAAAMTASPIPVYAAVPAEEESQMDTKAAEDEQTVPGEALDNEEYILSEASAQEEAAAYLRQNYIVANKIITNGGDSVVKSGDGLSYDVGLKTPSGSSITSINLKREGSSSIYKSGWYIDENEYIKTQKPTYTRSRSILKRPSSDQGKYSFNATLKLFDAATENSAIDDGTVQPLAEQTFVISLAPEEKVYKVSFEAVDKATKAKVDGAVITVEKDWSTVAPEADGSYAMKASETFMVTAEADGYVTYKNTAFKASADGTQTIELEKEQTYTYKFDIKDSKGAAIENAEISVTEGYYDTIQPEADGSYKLSGGKTYRYRASAPNYADVTGEIKPTEDKTIAVVLQKDIREYNVRFNILNTDGEPVTAASVEVSYEEYDYWEDMYVSTPVTPEADGSYKLEKGTEYDYTVKAEGYSEKTGKINPSGDDENITKNIILEKGAADPEDTKKVEAAKKAFDSEYGALRPKFAQYKNINALVLEHLKTGGIDTTGLTVSVESTNDSNYVAADGTIHYVRDDSFSGYIYSKNVPCTFKFKCGNAEAVSASRTVTVGWDLDFFFEQMQKEAETLTEDKLLGENSSAQEVTKDLTLPQSMGTSAKKVWSAITWESSQPEIISIQKPEIDAIINPAVGKVTAPTQDTQVTLTATFKANDAIMNSYVEKPEDIETVTKTFNITVKGSGEQKPTEEALLALLDKYYTADKLTDSVTGEVIDPNSVTGDIQLLRYTKIKDENGQSVFNNKEIEVTSSNDKLITVNGYRANVDVFTNENPDVKLLVKFTRDGISVTKEIPLHVASVTEAELDAEIEKMEIAKAHYFEGINDGANSDKNNITENLHAFSEMRLDENKNPIWIYAAKDEVGDGIIPDDFFEDPWEMEGAGYNKFKSSDNNVIRHDNLIVTRQENSREVTVSSLLSSARYGKYAEAHPDNEKLQKLYKQPVEVKLTVKGTVVPTESLEKAIADAKEFLGSVKEGSAPGEYPEGTIESLNKAIEAAQSVIEKPGFTEAEVEEAVKTLNAAVEAIKDTQNANKAFVIMNGNPVSGAMGMQFSGDVYSDAAEKAGFKKAAEFKKEVTVIDALVVMHQQMFGEDFDKNPQDYLVMGPTGWLSKVFGVDTINIGFYVNDAMPKDENGMGTMANTSILKDNDVLNVFVYGSAYQQDIYLKFDNTEYTTEADTKFEVTVTGFVTEKAMWGDVVLEPQSDCKVVLIPDDVSAQKIEAVTDTQGKAVFTVPQMGTYTMTVESCGSEFFIAPYAKVTVKENAVLAELEAAKKAAKEELAAYKELTDYREAQQEEIKNILSDSDKAIEVAGDKEAVGEAVKEARAKLDKVKTDAQLTEEEKEAAAKELEAAKKAAKEELAAYKELTDYREAQQEEIKNILSDSDKAIEVAGDKKAVGEAVKEAKAKLDKVKTDAQLTEEESKPNESKPDESKPSESNKPNKQDNKKPEGVKTGDETPILLLWTLLLSAGATGTAILVKKKK